MGKYRYLETVACNLYVCKETIAYKETMASLYEWHKVNQGSLSTHGICEDLSCEES